MRNTLRLGLALAFILAAADGSQAQELVVEFTNNSEHKVIELHIAEPGWLAEEPNILGSEPLAPGEIVEIGVAPDRSVCGYDVKVVFDNGLSSEDSGVDFCATSTYLALGGTRVGADDACNVEKEGTEVGELFAETFDMSTTTPESDAIAAMMMEALTAFVAGKPDEACAIYAKARAQMGG